MVPSDYAPLGFDGDRGFPQAVEFTGGGRGFRMSLQVTATDLPRLASLEPDRRLLDWRDDAPDLPTSASGSPRDHLALQPPGTLETTALRVTIGVREGGRRVAVRPVRVGRPLPAGRLPAVGLLLDVYVSELVIMSGNLVRPGSFGSRVVAGARIRFTGRPWLQEPSPQPQVDPYERLD